MTIRRVTIPGVFLAFVLLAGFAQAQQTFTIYWSGEPATIGTHQLPSSNGCALPVSPIINGLAPACVTLNAVYNAQMLIVGPGGVPPGVSYTWSTVSGGLLPPGIQINQTTGLISGTVTTANAGVYSFVVQAALSNSTLESSITYTLAAGSGQPIIAQTALPNTAVAGTPVSGSTPGSPWYTAAATGGFPCVTTSQFCGTNGTKPYYNWSFLGGGPVDGLTINPTTGVISGTPLSGGTFALTIQAEDGLGQTVQWATSMTIGGPSNFVITTTSVPGGAVGVAYSQPIATTGGPGSGVLWNVVSGILPPNINLSSTGTNGLLSGSPTTAGTFNFSLQASYNPGSGTVYSNVQAYSVTITQAVGSTLALPAPSAQAAAIGQVVSMTFAATGGTPAYTYTLLTGLASVPPGLTLTASTGVLAGTISNSALNATYTFTVEVTDSTGASAAATTSISVGNTLSLPVPSAQTAAIGQTVSMTFTATGGDPPYTYALLSGSLPAGLTYAQSGSSFVISGTISSTAVAGTYNFTVQVSDSLNNKATASTAFIVTGTTLTMPNPSGAAGAPGQTATLQFTATGGTSPYTYSITLVTLNGTTIATPSGMSINGTTGLVSFVITSNTQTGTYVVFVQAADSASHTTNAQATINVTSPLSMANPSAVTGTAGQTVTMQFTAIGGTTPYTFTITSVTLAGNNVTPIPSTITINSSGLVSFATTSTTATGAYVITVKVTDSSVPTQSATATGTITLGAQLTMANPNAVTGTVGQTVSITFTATGGTPPYTYSFGQGSLPPGLTPPTNTPTSGPLTISGIPTAPGSYAFQIVVTDSNMLQAVATGNITVNYLTLTGVTLSIPGAGGTITAGTQQPVTLTIPSAQQQQITGTISVSFVRTFDNNFSREVQFSNGSTVATFTIAAGQTTASFGSTLAVLVGTAKGSGTITATFKDSLGNNITPATLQPLIFSVAGAAPVIGGSTCPGCGLNVSAPANGTYTVTIIGYSSTLDMTSITFTFAPASNVNLASTTLTVQLGPAFAAWYGNSLSNQYGGQFMLTIPLNFTISSSSGGTGITNPIVSMSVTLQNSVGSVTATGNPQ